MNKDRNTGNAGIAPESTRDDEPFTHRPNAASGVRSSADLTLEVGRQLAPYMTAATLTLAVADQIVRFVTPCPVCSVAEGEYHVFQHKPDTSKVASCPYVSNVAWQPISTAPKDDREHKYILGGWYEHGFQVEQCYFDKDNKKWMSNRTWGAYPDYWMPWTEPKRKEE